MNWYKTTQLGYRLPESCNISEIGNCMLAAEIITKNLLDKGIKDFLVVEGYISFKMPSKELGWEEGITHTWIEYNNQIHDPTKILLPAILYQFIIFIFRKKLLLLIVFFFVYFWIFST